MPTRARTQALLEDLGRVLGLASAPRDGTGGVRLTLGGAVEVSIYEDHDDALLVVCPIAAMPRTVERALALSLFQDSLFSSDCAPFVIAADETGMLLLWGRLWTDDLDGSSLASLIEAVAGKVAELRATLHRAGR
jgi:hypothetical protein